MLKLVRRKGSDAWYLRGTVRGLRAYETAGTGDRKAAEAVRAKREAELLEESIFGKRAVVSFARCARSYLEFAARAPRTEADVQRLVEHFGVKLLSAIDQGAADAAVRQLLPPDARPATKRRAVYSVLTAILNHGAARQWCERPKFEQPALPKGKTRWLTPAEALRLIEAAAPHLRPLLRFVLCTGARMSEALDLTWADVDLPARLAIFRDTKNGGERAAALPPLAVETLANLPGRDGAVFRRDDGEPYHDAERQYGGQIKTAWRTALRRAKIAAPTTPHDLRHTWASWFYCVSKNLLLLKDEGGWKSLSMVERYTHLMPSSLAPEIAKVWGPSHPRLGALPAPRESEAKTA